MLHPHGGMLAAFFGARVADIGAKLAITFGEFSIQLHHRDRSLACRRTFLVQPDTIAQSMNIIFFETSIRALITHRGAIVTCIDTGLILYIRHNI